ncbi:MAG: ABC transporter ATP-binding protein [Lachnospiraceae bacterium]|nr:ABC transporter ATP-binding protein [Lachnospiraceae bacterium]
MIIEAKNVSYSYKSKWDRTVLNQVSVSFEEGTFYAIVGSSGSGKTTFLSLLAGLDHPVSGNILYNGEDIRKKGLNYHRRHNISLVFQNYNLIDYLTTEENVKLGGGKDSGELLREVSIPCEDWKRNVLQLSGGQQQRVAIARALASEAKVLLADEPTGNLDEDTAGEIIELIKRTAHELGKCVIVVTHSRQLAEEADVVLEISQGRLREQGKLCPLS